MVLMCFILTGGSKTSNDMADMYKDDFMEKLKIEKLL